MSNRIFKIALCQFKTIPDKVANIERAGDFIRRAAERGAKLISLPEMFNTPYDKEYFREYSEDLDGPDKQKPTVNFLRDIARETGTYLIGGSISEISNDKVYNTSLVYNPEGELVARHRKVHLFDIDVPGQRYMESETLSAGNQATVFDMDGVNVGVGICYDIRFPELAMLMRKKGAEVIVYPASFNPTTGPIHLQPLTIARALDTQSYVVISAPARDFQNTKGYQTWGHSQIINPNGLVVAQSELRETILDYEINLIDVENQRRGMPFDLQRRNDMYEIIEKVHN